jgi:beta-N-acetylhexosaminidase
VRRVVFLPFVVLLAVSCGGKKSPPAVETDVAVSPPVEEADPAAEKAARIALSLDDRLLAAQVILTGVDGKTALSGAMKDILRECPAGGIVLFAYNLDAGKETARAFLSECFEFISSEGVPPFIAVDHEGGQVHRFGPGVSRLPSAASWGEMAETAGREEALASLEEAAFRSGLEIRDLGITLNLAPVAEVLNAENRFFLEDRSFGGDPVFVEDGAAAFMRGMERAGLLCAVKHFPGNTADDPHSASPVISAGREALAEMTRPFAGLIRKQSPAALMVSHVLVPARDRDNIASLSPAVMKDWLRSELGYGGIIIADDFSMNAASASGLAFEQAALRSLAAGADMVMAWPRNAKRLHGAILNALRDGAIPRAQLRESAARIIAEKIRLGLIR